jgi:hypothetical protein
MHAALVTLSDHDRLLRHRFWNSGECGESKVVPSHS